MKTLHIFHHTDLDGMGIKILGLLYSKSVGMTPKTYCCGYGKINSLVKKCIAEENPEEIIIGDISVNKEVAELLELTYKYGVDIKLYDHHETALYLNDYDWATVKLQDGGLPCCGTKLLFNDPRFINLQDKLKYFVDVINDWDTWRWKEINNLTSRKLNSLLSILGEQEFTNYILQLFEKDYPIDSEDKLFSDKIKIMLETHEKLILQQVKSCESTMYLMNLWVEISNKLINKPKYEVLQFKTGVVFINNDLSDIGDRILDNHPELDILLMVVFPNTLSWRTNKHLPVSLSKIAKLATGSGGGHSCAAGSSIPFARFQDMFIRFMEDNFDDSLDYSNFISAALKRKRDEMEKLNLME